jgi:UDP-glucose pyrophosphorylase
MPTKEQLLTQLAPFGQEHLLAHWDKLSESQRENLAAQIGNIDFAQLAELYKNRDHLIDVASMVRQAQEPPSYKLESDGNVISRSDAIQAGRDALAAGKVAVLVVAGGQGTRLGFDHPKGMYPIGPVGDTTLFQIHVEKIIARGKQYGKPIPFCVMTSPATHDETVEYFAKNNRFGLAESQLLIFCQGTMPAVSLDNGRVLLAASDQIAMSPDGHGGMLAAFEKSGCLGDLLGRGVEMLFYFQVDNPLVDIANEEFLGYHILSRSELTSQVVRKQAPEDRVGNIVSIGDRLHVIEYSDLPCEFAERRNPDGSLEIWAGSIAVHIMGLDFLKQQAGNQASLPFHIAKKSVPYVDTNGNTVKPSEPNAIKFERFIFDLLPAAQNAAVVEVDLWYHFAPLKNASGAATDSPETVREQLSSVFAEWFGKVGVKTCSGIKIEISPLFANSPEVFAKRVEQGLVPEAKTGIDHDIRLSANRLEAL